MAGAPTLYGIPNCDQVRRARAWLAGRGVAHAFHDFRRDGLDAARARAWLAAAGAATLVNRKGTTWRALTDAERARADGDDGALALMLEKPAVIKRPVLETGGRVVVGFRADEYAALFP